MAIPAGLDERKIFAALSPGRREAVTAARDLARAQDLRLYLVGGAVRDLLLRRPLGDIDMTVEGDAPRFGGALARRIGARARAHGRFGTATIFLPSGDRLDLASSRAEVYERPAALPKVRPAAIEEDLARRDFPINAMAARLAPDHRRRILDPFGGRHDLARRTIRFLHPRSPFDDPTRAFRAVRYANRLGFSIAPAARAAIREALEDGSFDALSGDRLRREVERLFLEPDRAGAVARMGALGLIAALHPALPHSRRALGRIRRVEGRIGGAEAGWFPYLLAWASELEPREADELASRLNLDRAAAARLREWPQLLDSVRGIGKRSRGEAASVLRRLNRAERLAVAEALSAADRRAIIALTSEPVTLRIRGRDLVRAGAAPGPQLGRALARTFAARAEGTISEEEELDFALAIWRREK